MGRERKAGWGVEACGGAVEDRPTAAAGCEVVVVSVIDSAGAGVAHSVVAAGFSVAAESVGAVGSVVDGAQQDLGCPLGPLPRWCFLLPWCH